MAEENGNNSKESFDDLLTVKMYKSDLGKFKTKSKAFGKPYQIMLREIIEAFNNDRLRITPTDEQKESLKIYQS